MLAERGIDICHETVRFWWNRFGPMFAAEIKKRRVALRHDRPEWQWHLDEDSENINGTTHYLWRAVDHEGEVLEVVATKRCDRKAVLHFLKRLMKRCGRPHRLITKRLPCSPAGASHVSYLDSTHWHIAPGRQRQPGRSRLGTGEARPLSPWLRSKASAPGPLALP
jgi:putative transposase